MAITDEGGAKLYEAWGESHFFSPRTWHLSSAGGALAKFRRKPWTFWPTWLIDSAVGSFMIKRRVGFTPHYDVIGGPFDGAEITGTIWGRRTFKISKRGNTIARATGRVFSLGDRHDIEILEPDSNFELLTVISMVMLQSKRREEAAEDHD